MDKRKLVVSTGNGHKIDEIKSILSDFDIEILSKNDIGLEEFDVIEDGETLEENSIKKAKELAEKTDYMVIADDTGLFVNALNGEPGVFSSRYAGEEGNSKKNCEKLIQNLEGIEDRSAYFKTVIALITEDKKVFKADGLCKGTIIKEAKGENGFGYDPLFVPEGYNKTFAELGNDVKNKISHRALALEELKNIINSLI
ncbi:RdgB/HAM1 family non-canonical purine NTP pyrophosphatase [Tissierella sp. Yu-01]|uniref:RdgB/HAM1 family non-canonical purine NTP pyrophosphatase n=1 Tax=Tissierella sp. Yu-01 TaxID=3035694 RepID=UPI00240DFF0F|nr:RdgB/HAM1 family non-canonical purine NTP pyrophosphatase [Tissierella sp. Yu-01]WFA08923.1 RdgB/HAM1 family non-canonical purine NTP pyrophosphatase [Tissierella sp. Yu-01]